MSAAVLLEPAHAQVLGLYLHEPRAARTSKKHDLAATEKRRRKNMQSILDKYDIHCECKCSLIVACAAVDKAPGCKAWHKTGKCACEPRLLPSCILNPETPHGCDDWREGHSCSCQRQMIPKCLITGCEDRQDGRRCECSRTTTEICEHVRELWKKMADLTPEEAIKLAQCWSEAQLKWNPDEYREPEKADEGSDMPAGPEAVAIMEVRVWAKRSPWHPHDKRCPLAAVNRGMAAGLHKLASTIKVHHD